MIIGKLTIEVTYTEGMVHAVRITASGDHFTVEFDANGDNLFAATEVLFDVDDNAGLDSGRVGFYAFDNGATATQPCGNNDCWFDDLVVDVQTVAPDPCNGISYEGACQGQTLSYCLNGVLQSQNCGNCCGWVPQWGLYSCVDANWCYACYDECAQGEGGCNSDSTHSWTCGQADGDQCLERVYTYCESTGLCDPATQACLDPQACVPDCSGKECGDDGCGGVCGF